MRLVILLIFPSDLRKIVGLFPLYLNTIVCKTGEKKVPFVNPLTSYPTSYILAVTSLMIICCVDFIEKLK